MKQTFHLPLWSVILSIFMWLLPFVFIGAMMIYGMTFLVIALLVLPINIYFTLIMPRYTLVNDDSIQVILVSGKRLCFDRKLCRVTPIDKSYLSGSVRTFGSWGFMGFTGFYYSRKNGNYKLYLINQKDLCLIEDEKGKKFVINLKV